MTSLLTIPVFNETPQSRTLSAQIPKSHNNVYIALKTTTHLTPTTGKEHHIHKSLEMTKGLFYSHKNPNFDCSNDN